MADALPPDEAADLRHAIRTRGLDALAAAFGLNPITLLRAAVGLPLHNATRQLIEGKLNGDQTNHQA